MLPPLIIIGAPNPPTDFAGTRSDECLWQAGLAWCPLVPPMQPPKQQRPVSWVWFVSLSLSPLSVSATLRMFCSRVLTFTEGFQLLGVLVVSPPFWHKIFNLSSPRATIWQEFKLSVSSELGFFLAINKIMLPNLLWHIYLLLCL